jgi:hypothetical protein
MEDKNRIIDVWLGGARVVLPDMPPEIPRHPCEDSQGYWTRLYTRESTGHTSMKLP